MSRPADAPVDGASPLADPALRLGAWLIDATAATLPLWFTTPVAVLAGSPTIAHAGLYACVVAQLAILALDLVWLHRYGQTLGKRLLGLRIVRTDGERATLGRIVVRRILAPGALGMIPWLGPVFSLFDSLAIFTSERRTLHDRIADTIVVDLRRGGPKDKPAEF